MKKIKELYNDNKKFIYSSCISFGCTILRFLIYFLMLWLIDGKYLIANLISYVISFTILFYANQKLFDSKPQKKKEEVRQILSFVLFRFFGFFIDSALLMLFIEKFELSSFLSRLFSSLIAFIYNYQVNKVYVFKYRTPIEIEFMKSKFYLMMKLLFGWVFRLWFNPKIIGRENIPSKDNIVIAGNHKSMADPCMVVISTKRVVHFLAKDKFYDKKIIGKFFKYMQCIRVNTKEKDGKALKSAIDVLNKGGVIGIFPEGTRNKTNNILLPFKYGALKMAQETNSWIVPFGITGDYKFRSKNLSVRYGKPYKITSNDLEKENKILVEKVKELIKQD